MLFFNVVFCIDCNVKYVTQSGVPSLLKARKGVPGGKKVGNHWSKLNTAHVVK